jgi:predicted  nucleic acid-binding Zn-ribbon protein
MGATLDALHRLQRIEIELSALREKVNAKHRAVRGSKHRLQQIDADLAAKQVQLKQDQVEADRSELDRKARESEITKLREMLNRVKTNKEYSAILTQINTDKADNAKLEDRVLKMLSALDQSKEAIRQLQESRAKESERLQSLTASAAEFETSVRGQIDALETKRQEATEELPATVVKMFDRIAKKHGGEAMARAVQPNPRREEFVCEGCNMGVTLEQVSALQGRDEIQMCHTCGRILYMAEAVAEAKK